MVLSQRPVLPQERLVLPQEPLLLVLPLVLVLLSFQQTQKLSFLLFLPFLFPSSTYKC